MIRSTYSFPILLVFVLGCTGQPSIMPQASSGAASGTAQIAMTDPELETVPEQSEPEPLDATLQAEQAFINLMKAAETNDADAWATAEKELTLLGKSALPTLVARLEDENRMARELASMFVVQLGPDAEFATDGLIKLLEDDSPYTRVNAASALSTRDEFAGQVAPILKQLLANDDRNVRLTAAISLRNVGNKASTALVELTGALNDPEAQVRTAAAETLGSMGPSARESLSALRELAQDQDQDVAKAASRAIRQIDETAQDNAPAVLFDSDTK